MHVLCVAGKFEGEFDTTVNSTNLSLGIVISRFYSMQAHGKTHNIVLRNVTCHSIFNECFFT